METDGRKRVRSHVVSAINLRRLGILHSLESKLKE